MVKFVAAAALVATANAVILKSRDDFVASCETCGELMKATEGCFPEDHKGPPKPTPEVKDCIIKKAQEAGGALPDQVEPCWAAFDKLSQCGGDHADAPEKPADAMFLQRDDDHGDDHGDHHAGPEEEKKECAEGMKALEAGGGIVDGKLVVDEAVKVVKEKMGEDMSPEQIQEKFEQCKKLLGAGATFLQRDDEEPSCKELGKALEEANAFTGDEQNPTIDWKAAQGVAEKMGAGEEEFKAKIKECMEEHKQQAAQEGCQCFANGADNEEHCEGKGFDAKMCENQDGKCHWGPGENPQCAKEAEEAKKSF